MDPLEITLPFLGKKQFASDAYEFAFGLSTSLAFTYLPGQYIRITLPHEPADERGIRRYFSLTSSPTDLNRLTITTRIIQSSFKQHLASLTPGTPVTIFGPLGKFVLPDEETRPLVFLAGGIGITPFLSMLRYTAAKQLPLEITLIVSFSSPEEMIAYDELQHLVATHANIQVIYTLTHPASSTQSWYGETGRITEPLIKKYIPSIATPIYFISGPQVMVDAMVELIQTMGVTQDNIKAERFPGY